MVNPASSNGLITVNPLSCLPLAKQQSAFTRANSYVHAQPVAMSPFTVASFQVQVQSLPSVDVSSTSSFTFVVRPFSSPGQELDASRPSPTLPLVPMDNSEWISTSTTDPDLTSTRATSCFPPVPLITWASRVPSRQSNHMTI